jgi:hypothetical protein
MQIPAAFPTVGVGARLAIPLALVALAWLLDRYQRPRILRCWRAWRAIARRRWLAVALVGIAALALRLAVVPSVPVPQVVYPDEFSHLLFAETLASGRFTNPTPPGWKNIEALFATSWDFPI